MREAVVDANILLRFLLDEPRDLADRVVAIFEAAERLHVALVVTALTLAEVVYVLESVYKWERRTIADRLLELVSASVLQIAEQNALAQALAWYRDIGSLHFADAYIAAVAAAQDHGAVISMDRALRRVPDITLVQDPGPIEHG